MTANFERSAAVPGGGEIDRLGAAHEQSTRVAHRGERNHRFRHGDAATPTQTRDLWGLFRQAPGFICILRGPDHVFEFANDSYLRLVGGRDVIGKPVCEALPEIASQAFPRMLDEVYRTGQPYVGFETPVELLASADESLEQHLLNFIYQPLKDEQGRSIGVFVEGFDDTERVRAQATARGSEARLSIQQRFYETVLTNTPDHAYIFGLDHRFIYANQPLLETLGKVAEGVVGKSFLELGYPDWHAARHDREIEQVIATKQPVRGVVTFAGRLGQQTFDYIFTPVLNEEGEVEAVAGTTRDITELTRTRKATARLASIVDSSDDAIVSKALDGVVRTWNKAAERMFGYREEEAIGHAIASLIIPADRMGEENDILRRLARGEGIDHFETTRRRKDGSVLDVSVTISPLRDKGGQIIGASKIARDITERKRNEHHRDLLIHELNHRVKNTLASVQALATQTFRGSEARELARTFEARLMAMSTAQNVLTRENWQGAAVRDIADTVVAAWARPTGDRVVADGPEVRLRPSAALALAMALHELATNAAKYGALSNAQGSVTIDWSLSPDASPSFRLRWHERGGPPVHVPAARGFGTRLVEHGLSQEFGGSVDLAFEENGVQCLVEAPFDEIREQRGW